MFRAPEAGASGSMGPGSRGRKGADFSGVSTNAVPALDQICAQERPIGSLGSSAMAPGVLMLALLFSGPPESAPEPARTSNRGSALRLTMAPHVSTGVGGAIGGGGRLGFEIAPLRRLDIRIEAEATTNRRDRFAHRQSGQVDTRTTMAGLATDVCVRLEQRRTAVRTCGGFVAGGAFMGLQDVGAGRGPWPWVAARAGGGGQFSLGDRWGLMFDLHVLVHLVQPRPAVPSGDDGPPIGRDPSRVGARFGLGLFWNLRGSRDSSSQTCAFRGRSPR